MKNDEVILKTYNEWSTLSVALIPAGKNRLHVFCQCSCGKREWVRKDRLLSGVSKNCGHGADTVIPGAKFGKRTIVKELLKRANGNRVFLCRCECGHEGPVNLSDLKIGKSRSCNGCAKRKEKREKPPEYELWRAMWRRCTESDHASYMYYGAKGIMVDEAWKSFDQFLADVGPRPSPKHTLDRKNGDLNYTKDNVRWVVIEVQANNRSNNRLLTLDGVSKTIAQWARHTGIPDGTIRARRADGWSDEAILTTPVRPRKKSASP